jgi:hypothetical protein
MDEFKNSFYRVAVDIANLQEKTSGGQLAIIDNFTMNAPILKGIPFQKSSHPLHHVFGDVVDVQGMQIIDFDAPLPTMRVETQLGQVNLTPFGGNFKFGEDVMLQTYGDPKRYLMSKMPAIMRESGARLERSFYVNNFLPTAIKNGTALSAKSDPVATDKYGSMVAVTWIPSEMTGLHSPLPYGAGSEFGQLFKPEWVNGGNRHDIGGDVIGYAASVKMLVGISLINKRKIAALLNIAEVPTANQLVELVTAAEYSGSTRIYCPERQKNAIAAKFAQSNQGNGLVSVSGEGEVRVLGVPVVSSHNIPRELGGVTGLTHIA